MDMCAVCPKANPTTMHIAYFQPQHTNKYQSLHKVSELVFPLKDGCSARDGSNCSLDSRSGIRKVKSGDSGE